MRYYDRQGNPIDMMQWAALSSGNFETARRVAKTELGGDDDHWAGVSTVWLGIDHNFWGDGPPLIFETMVFGGGEWDQYWQRYSTEDEAMAGHAAIVEQLTNYRALEVWRSSRAHN